MSFFYDLNKRLAGLAAKTEQEQIAESKKSEAIAQSPLIQALNESAMAEAGYSAKAGRAGKDLGKPGKNFAKIAKGAAKRYGSKEAGERVAGAVLNKLRHPSEGIENEGNAFTGALAKTPKGGKFKVGDKEFTDTSSIEEGFKEMDAWLAQREKEKGTGKFDKSERTLPGGMKATTYTRRHDDDAEDDEEVTTITIKKKGRPKGTGRKLGAKGPTGKSKLMKKDSIKEEGDEHVCEMCGQPIAEKAVSVAQRRAAGIAHAAQKGEIPKSELKGASKEMAKMSKGELHKFAATKEKGLPKKVKEEGKPDFLDLDKDGNKEEPMKKAAKQAKDKKEEKVDETTVAGSVATATPSGKSSKGGMQFGKGVYESLDKQFKQALTESIQVQETVEECGMEGNEPTITIQASGEEAMKLMALLKLAGLEGKQDVCPGCGHSPCDCEEELDENSPDWPTNTEVGGKNDQTLQTYAGGLNKPKSTGQTTIPVIASQLRRQISMEENVELERTLFNTWKNYKG